MKMVKICIIATCFFFIAPVKAADSLAAKNSKILLIHDPIDKSSEFYVKAFREQLTAKGFQLEEATAEKLSLKDPSTYYCIVVYGMVMAFNTKSSVRKWMQSEQKLENGKMLIFITANRWFKDDLQKDLVKIAQKKRAKVIDAVSMATTQMSEVDKIKKIEAFLSKLDDSENFR